MQIYSVTRWNNKLRRLYYKQTIDLLSWLSTNKESRRPKTSEQPASVVLQNEKTSESSSEVILDVSS